MKADYFFYPEAGNARHPLYRYKFLRTLLEWNKTIVYVSVFYLIFTTVLVEGYQIPTGSMEPTLHGSPNWHGDRIFAMKGIFRLWPLERGDIVIFISVEDRETFIVKRLVGLPGDTIQIKNTNVYINGEKVGEAPFDKIQYENRNDHYPGLYRFATRGPLTIPQDCYFVLGDNSGNSKDSRVWGWLSKRDLLGKAVLIWFPRGQLLLK